MSKTLAARKRRIEDQVGAADLANVDVYRHLKTGETRHIIKCRRCVVHGDYIRPRTGDKQTSWSSRWKVDRSEPWTMGQALERWDRHAAEFHLDLLVEASGYREAQA